MSELLAFPNPHPKCVNFVCLNFASLSRVNFGNNPVKRTDATSRRLFNLLRLTLFCTWTFRSCLIFYSFFFQRIGHVDSRIGGTFGLLRRAGMQICGREFPRIRTRSRWDPSKRRNCEICCSFRHGLRLFSKSRARTSFPSSLNGYSYYFLFSFLSTDW